MSGRRTRTRHVHTAKQASTYLYVRVRMQVFQATEAKKGRIIGDKLFALYMFHVCKRKWVEQPRLVEL